MVLIKFEKNLIKISKSNNWEQASKEWGFIYERKRDNKDNHCLCSTNIKNQYYYYNKNTKKIICCGTGCRKHIDDYIGDKKYNNNFISDLIYLIDNDSVGDYDLEKYCKDNEQIVWDKMFWNIESFNTEESLNKYYDYLEEYWSDLLNIDCLLEKINEKIQGINELEVLKLLKDIDTENEKKKKKLEEEKLFILKLEKQKLEEKQKQVEYKKELNKCYKELSNKQKEMELLEHTILKLKKKIKVKTNCCQALFVCNCE